MSKELDSSFASDEQLVKFSEGIKTLQPFMVEYLPGRQVYEHVLDGDKLAQAAISDDEADNYDTSRNTYELDVTDTSWHEGVEVESSDIRISKSYTVSIAKTKEGEEITDGSVEIIHFDITRYYKNDDEGNRINVPNPIVALMLEAKRHEEDGNEEWAAAVRAFANRLHRQSLEMEQAAGEGQLAKHLGFMTTLNQIQTDLDIKPTQ